jgi:hypothetical protein
MDNHVPDLLNDIGKYRIFKDKYTLKFRTIGKHILVTFGVKALDRIKRRKVKTISAKDALETTLSMIAESVENCSIIPRKPIVKAQADEFRTEYLQKIEEVSMLFFHKFSCTHNCI